MAGYNLVSRLKNAFLAGALALFLAACGGGSSGPPPPPPPPQPSYSQTATLARDIDIDYAATFANMNNPVRSITHNGTQFGNDFTIPTSPYSETFQNLRKGSYAFTLKTTTPNVSPISLTRDVPNYLPSADFSSLQSVNLNGRYNGSSTTLDLEAVVSNSDKNLEDRPVSVVSARSLEGKTQVSLNQYNLTITAVSGSQGAYQVEVNYGSAAGGNGTGNISGQITAVPEQIAFMSLINNNFDIHIGNLSNNTLTGIQRLTTDPAQDFEPAFSLTGDTGDKIIFTSNRDGKNRIYSMNVDGNNQQVISPDLGLAQNPVWCGDQNLNQIILFSFVDSGRTGIARINTDGTGFRRLVDEPYSGIITGNPTCSPNGLEFAFSSSRDGNSEIYTANLADGSNQRNITNNPAADDQPRWSSNNRIAFITDRDTPGQVGELNLYVINADGTGLARLTNLTGREMDLSWSPDSSRFVFTKVAVIGDPFQIYIMNTDGTGLVQLTTQGQNGFPAWRPN